MLFLKLMRTSLLIAVSSLFALTGFSGLQSARANALDQWRMDFQASLDISAREVMAERALLLQPGHHARALPGAPPRPWPSEEMEQEIEDLQAILESGIQPLRGEALAGKMRSFAHELKD